MQVTKVNFKMLRKTGQYENNTAEVEVELQPGESVEEAWKHAQANCAAMLRLGAPCPTSPEQYTKTYDEVVTEEKKKLAIRANTPVKPY